MPITTVTLTNTFDEWRVKTNQTIVALDDDSTGILRGNSTLTGTITLTNTNSYENNITLNISSGMIKGDGGLLTNLAITPIVNSIYNTANSSYNVANSALANTTTTYVGDLTIIGAINHTGRYVQNVTTVIGSNIDCAKGNYFIKTAAGPLSWTFSNVASSGAYIAVLELTNGGTGTQTWPITVKWPSGVAPILTTSGVDLIVFVTDDGGSTWRGLQSMLDSK